MIRSYHAHVQVGSTGTWWCECERWAEHWQALLREPPMPGRLKCASFGRGDFALTYCPFIPAIFADSVWLAQGVGKLLVLMQTKRFATVVNISVPKLLRQRPSVMWSAFGFLQPGFATPVAAKSFPAAKSLSCFLLFECVLCAFKICSNCGPLQLGSTQIWFEETCPGSGKTRSMCRGTCLCDSKTVLPHHPQIAGNHCANHNCGNNCVWPPFRFRICEFGPKAAQSRSTHHCAKTFQRKQMPESCVSMPPGAAMALSERFALLHLLIVCQAELSKQTRLAFPDACFWR